MSLNTRANACVGLLAMLTLVAACSRAPEHVETPGKTEPPMDSLVTAEWLNQHLHDPDLVVLDCTVLVEQDASGNFLSSSGRAVYDAGHIPTAGFADLTGDLSDTDSSLEFALPTAEQFASTMSALGVGDDSRVVLYSATYPAWAARVWWMLRWIGFDKAALLDGGLNAWTADGLPLSTEPPTRPARTLTANVRPQLIADRDEVLAAIGNDGVTIVDVLPAPHYRGEMSMYDRPGHVKSAVNMPVSSLADEEGHYLTQDELAAIVNVDPADRVITYCGGGIAASSAAFVLTRLGYPDVAVYTNSLQEWAADPDNPMESEWDTEESGQQPESRTK
jgi:thiosulfate/3-mercaptopyruvate sulfurtransferase